MIVEGLHVDVGKARCVRPGTYFAITLWSLRLLPHDHNDLCEVCQHNLGRQ